MIFRAFASSKPRPVDTGRGLTFNGALLQAALAALIIGGLWLITTTTLHNLSVRGITTGYGFLTRSAGFDVAFSLLPFTARSPLWMAFFVGVTNTLFLAAVGIVFGTLVAVLVISLRLSHSPIARGLAAGYVGVFRNTPVLLHLFFWYFAVFALMPQIRQSLTVMDAAYLNNRGLFLPSPEASPLLWVAALLCGIAVLVLSSFVRRRRPTAFIARRGVSIAVAVLLAAGLVVLGAEGWSIPARAGLGIKGGIKIIPELMAVLVAISLYSSAFIAELIRGAIDAVPKGQAEAGAALGLSQSVIMRTVILPQAIRISIPPLTNQYVNLIKQTAIVSAIAFPDLMHIFGKTVLTQTGQAIEVLMLVTSVYLAISLVCAGAMHIYAASLRARGGVR